MQRTAAPTAMLAPMVTQHVAAKTYTPVMQALHWANTALLSGAFIAAWTIHDTTNAADHAWRLMLHRSFGVTILLLTMIRLMVRQRTPIPPLPGDIPRLQRLAARINIIALYTQLLTQPLTGLAASVLHGDHIILFGASTLPAMLPINRPLAHAIFQVHGAAALVFLMSIGLHIAAALYHRVVRKDHVLATMLPMPRLAGRRPP